MPAIATGRAPEEPPAAAQAGARSLNVLRTTFKAAVRLARPAAAAVLLLLLSAAGVSTGAGRTAAPAPTGFTPLRAEAQARCEARLQQLPAAPAFREHLRAITAEPHPTGSAAQLRVAGYLADALQRAGLETERAEYDVYLPQLDGLVNEVAIVTPVRLPLLNREPALAEDPFTSHPDLLPGWNAFSGSGDVTAPVVYANYGRREDFEELERRGVTVRGRIVLARYGGNFRGYKVKFAEERGAAAVIMFSDPAPDLAPYPDGPGMTPYTIQRGSVLTLSYTGDPLTPFAPALPLDAPATVQRLDPAAVAFHTIPVLPIGYGPASEILARMTGAPAPATWRSGIAVPHRLTGGDDLTVRVHVRQRFDFTRAVNVLGMLRGTEFPDEWIILGSHYDPWSFGAHDPNGGTAMLLVLAEALGTLAREGCAPRRSIMIAHWDAEEYGIIGSTEWVEHHRDALARYAIAYFNADGAVTGSQFSAASSPSLKQPIIDAAAAVAYPAGGTIYQHWLRDRPQPPIGDLGGGSDHVAFYTHAGIPSAGASFGSSNGIYHSNYDTFRFFERFSDTTFQHGAALARFNGLLALRFANADILPYDVTRYGTDILHHIGTLERLGAERGLPVRLDELRRATESFLTAAQALAKAREAWLATPNSDEQRRRAVLADVNTRMIALEKAFIHPGGLQERPWSRSLYASPDPFSGYASWMLPGLRYEIETGNAAALAAWQATYVAALEQLQRGVQEITALLTK